MSDIQYPTLTDKQQRYQDAINSGKQQLDNSLTVAATIDPNKRAKAQQLSISTGIPVEVVDRNMEAVEISDKQRKYQAALGKSSSVELKEWMARPENAMVSHDDIGPLDAVVNAFGRFGLRARAGFSQREAELYARTAEDAGKSFTEIYESSREEGPGYTFVRGQIIPTEKGRASAAEAAARFAYTKLYDKGESVEGAEKSLLKVGELGRRMSEYPKTAYSQEQQDLIMEAGKGGLMPAIEAAVSSPLATLALSAEIGLEFAPAIVGAGITTALTKSPAAGAIFMGSASGLTERYASPAEFFHKRGFDLTNMEDVRAIITDPSLMEEAAQYGFTRGAIIGTIDAASGGMASKTFGGMVRNFLTQSVIQPGMGGGGEALAQLATEGKIDAGEVVLEALAEFATTPLEITALGGRKFMSFRDQAKRAAKALQNQKMFQSMSDSSEASELRKRLPERFKQFVESVTKEGAIKEVFIDAEAFQTYFQENEIDPFDLAQNIPGVFEQLNEALNTGGDLVIPIGDFATYIAPSEHFDGLKGSIRLRPDDMTMNEAAVFEEAKAASVAAIAEDTEVSGEDQQIFDSIQHQLRVAGRSVDVAKAEATGLTAFVNTMAERTGRVPMEVYKSMGLEIQGPIPETLQGRDIDQIDLMIDAIRKDTLPTQEEAFGASILEFAREVGISDDAGDLAAMDVDADLKPFIAKLLKEEGMTLDDAALRAHELGYFPDVPEGERVTIDQFLDAIGEELAGTPVFSEISADVAAQEQIAAADDLVQFLDERGIDINTASNEEIKAALQEADVVGREFEQVDTDTEAFKTWFGDSKVVDDAGEPLVVHHGGFEASKIEVFSPDYGGQTTGNNEHGAFHFVDVLEVAEDYGRQSFNRRFQDDVESLVDEGIIDEAVEFDDHTEQYGFVEELAEKNIETQSVYLKVENPIVLDMKGEVIDVLFIERLSKFVKTGEDENGEFFEDYNDLVFGEFEESDIANYKDEIEERARDNYGLEEAEEIEEYMFRDATQEVLYYNGIEAEQTPIDGIIIKNMIDDIGPASKQIADQYIVFDPENVKSTSNIGTFDPSDPRILFQEKRGQITFGDGSTLIKLFESANLSTFIHESGHLYLDTFQRIAEGEVPKQIQDDWKTISDYLGIKPGETITTEQHETWARSFEAYTMEGKAPSIALRDAFARFRSWMLTVYRQIKNLDVELTPEIREVMDRMLATDEEIETAKRQMNFDAMFETAVEGNMTKAEFASYQKAVERASREAQEEVTRKTVNELTRTQKKWWKEEEAKVRSEVEEQVYTDPIYNAWHLLTKGEYFDGVTPDEISGLKLSREALVDQYGPEILKYLPKAVPPVFAKEGGFHPDQVAILFDMSGAELIKGLTNMPPPKQVVEQQTRATMLERHGDMMNDGGLQEAVIEAVHGDKRGEVLAIELNRLQRRGGKTDASASTVAKLAAKRIIAGKKTNDAIAFSRYAAAETRWAKESEILRLKGDDQGAAEAKRKQLLNHYMFMEARDAAEKVDSILRYTQRLGKKGVRKNIAPDYLEQIDDLLNRFDFRKSVSLREVARRESLKAFVAAKEAAGEPIVIPQSVLDEAERRSYKDMPLEEVYGVRDALKNLQHLGRKKEEYVRNQKKRSLQADANLIADALEKNVKEIISPENSRTRWEIAKKTGREYMGILTKAQTYIEAMDGGTMGVVYDILKRDIDEASVSTAQRLEKMADDFTEIVAKHYPGTFFKSIKSLNGDKVYIPERNYSYSKAERISIALNMGNEGNKTKFMTGRNMSQDVLDKILSKENFSENDWAFVQSIWDYMDSYFDEISALEKERTGFAPEKVEAQAINTPYGQIKGGYYPISYDAALSLRAYAHETEALYEKMKGGSFARAQTKHGFTKARTEGVDRAIRIDLGVIGQHLNQVIIDLEMSRAIESASAVLHHRTTEKAIKSRLGMEAFQMLDLWIMDVAVGGIQKQDALSLILSSLRSSVSAGAMAWKFATTVIQISGFSHTIVELGPKYTYRGLMAMKKKLPWDVMNDVYEMSPFMKIRATTLQRDMADVMKKMEGRNNDIARTYFWPIVKMQQMVDMPTWLGAYEKGLAEGKSDKDAIRFADLMVEKAQGSGLMATLSGIERGTTMKQFRLSESVKMWTTFYSYFNTKLNIAMRKTKQTSFKDPIQVARLASDYIMLFWLEALIGELLLGRDPDFEDEDEAEKAMIDWNLSLIGSQVTASFPLLREVSGAMRGFSGAPGGARALEDVGSSAVRLGKEVAKIVDDDEEIDVIKAIQNALKLLNVALPVKIPVSQFNTTLEAIDRESKGEDVKPMDYLRRPPR